MYIPGHNEETRIPVMHELIRAHAFGTLVSLCDKGVHTGATEALPGLVASHLPMMLETDGSEYGTLKAHVARGNTQWRDLTSSVDALAIFAGHHHYISASWYPKVSGKGAERTGAEVPTWNYVVVHAYGTLKAIEDPEWLLEHLTSLTNTHEAASANPWKVTDAPDSYIRQQMRGIVGLEMPIRRLEGKWKLSQNRNERDRAAVIEGLSDLQTAESLAMKRLVERK